MPGVKPQLNSSYCTTQTQNLHILLCLLKPKERVPVMDRANMFNCQTTVGFDFGFFVNIFLHIDVGL